MSKRTYKLPNGYTLFVHGKGTERQLRLSVSNEKEPIPVYEEIVFESLLEMVDRLRKELEEAQEPTSKTLERMLLEMWHSQGIKEIYKYKHRIKIYRREGLDGYDLFNDITCGLLFTEVEDTANYRDATPEDFRVSVDFLLNKDERENQDEHI